MPFGFTVVAKSDRKIRSSVILVGASVFEMALTFSFVGLTPCLWLCYRSSALSYYPHRLSPFWTLWQRKSLISTIILALINLPVPWFKIKFSISGTSLIVSSCSAVSHSTTHSTTLLALKLTPTTNCQGPFITILCIRFTPSLTDLITIIMSHFATCITLVRCNWVPENSYEFTEVVQDRCWPKVQVIPSDIEISNKLRRKTITV